MSGRFRKNIEDLAGYVPGEQPQDGAYIKLNTNENPYPPSPRVVAALKRAAGGALRLYPEPMGRDVRLLAASVYALAPEKILVGNGSDELLSIIVRAFVGVGDRVLYPEPTYTLYDTLVAIQEGVKVTLPYTSDFSLPEAFFAEKAALTFVCNPNSPSGTLLPLSDIERLARSSAGAVVVDEAYIDFSDVSATAIPLLKQFHNLIVLRTFSKSFSLAGMRIGLALASEEMISGLLKIKDSYNVNRLSQVAAAAALGDLAWMERSVGRIQKSRKKLVRGLEKLGFLVYPSQANFVLARRAGQNLRGLYEELKRRKILVRYFAQPGLEDCLRITVGAPAEVRALLDQLGAIIKGLGSVAMKPIQVTELDHIVLNVKDIDRALAFYGDVLGLKIERLDEFRSGKIGFPSVRINQDTIIDLFPAKEASARPGNLNHFCLVVGKDDFSGIVDYLNGHGVTIRTGPISRWGARGRATSVYFHDPDENEIEIRCY